MERNGAILPQTKYKVFFRKATKKYFQNFLLLKILKDSLVFCENMCLKRITQKFFFSSGVREEEEKELSVLKDRVQIPIKESVREASCKVNILLQAYIARLELQGCNFG
tara:strand:- start:311 stop:637 length:327 start_codon:yes stop_codon:yes gene_type:complete